MISIMRQTWPLPDGGEVVLQVVTPDALGAERYQRLAGAVGACEALAVDLGWDHPPGGEQP